VNHAVSVSAHVHVGLRLIVERSFTGREPERLSAAVDAADKLIQ
ncbi:unnamed protein product, partial [marine sediment metagenome]